MDVGVHHRLACRFAVVNPDIETIWMYFTGQIPARASLTNSHRLACSLGGRSYRLVMCFFGHDQYMSFTDREGIENGKRNLVFQLDAGKGNFTKWALVGHVWSLLTASQKYL